MPEATEEQLTKCRLSTMEHREEVRKKLDWFVMQLLKRATVHDLSKLEEPELSSFAAVQERMKDIKFGTPEYKAALEDIRPAIEHHRTHNAHHPEFHEKGVGSMTLVDLVEMFSDWYASSYRNKDGSIIESIPICCERYEIPPMLEAIFQNTVTAMMEEGHA